MERRGLDLKNSSISRGKQNRREFLSAAAVAAGSLGLTAASFSAVTPEWPNRQEGMAYRRLGRTNFMISEIVMGGGGISSDSYEHVLQALDMGLNYLDTAPAYGRGESEKGLARVIKARPRDDFFITTKVSLWDLNRNRLYQEIFDSLSSSEQNRLKHRAGEEIERRGSVRADYFVDYFSGQREELEAAALSNVMEKEFGRRIDRDKDYKQIILNSVDESLTRLGTDYVDILMCPHGANTPFELLHFPEIQEAFEILNKAGKVRYLGVSAHTDPAGILEAAVEVGIYSVAMIAYNIVNHRYVDKILEDARKSGLGMIAMKVARPVHPGRGEADPKRVKQLQSQMEGPWTVPQKAYLWALRNRNLSAVISAMDDAAIVAENLRLVTRME
jgi:aryl-alcohol dehydrogenase-like predicted oxidoreductase